MSTGFSNMKVWELFAWNDENKNRLESAEEYMRGEKVKTVSS